MIPPTFGGPPFLIRLKLVFLKSSFPLCTGCSAGAELFPTRDAASRLPCFQYKRQDIVTTHSSKGADQTKNTTQEVFLFESGTSWPNILKCNQNNSFPCCGILKCLNRV